MRRCGAEKEAPFIREIVTEHISSVPGNALDGEATTVNIPCLCGAYSRILPMVHPHLNSWL